MRGKFETLALASRLAIRHPTELIDRLVSRWETPRISGSAEYVLTDWAVCLQQLTVVIGEDITVALQDPELAVVEQEVAGRIANLDRTPFGSATNADLLLAKTCYALCRIMKPACIVETGVAYGMSSSFFLAALERNNKGVLHSIDLPPIAQAADDYVGVLIPRRLVGRWRLHRGATRRVLPKLVTGIAPIDIFCHDSLHTYSSMLHDLRTVLPHTARGAAVIVDDVESNSAYSEWTSLASPAFSAVVRQSQKRSLFGIAIL